MQQRKPKVCAETAAQGISQQEGSAPAAAHAGTAGDLLEAEEALERAMPRKKKLAAEKRWSSVVNVVLIAFVMTVPPLVVIFGSPAGAPAVWIASAKAHFRRGSGEELLGGLLPGGFDEKSCRSRYQSYAYRRKPTRRPSLYLIAKLRRQEELQRRCGPNTESYKRAVQQLRAGRSIAGASSECRYLVSISYRGLGNRILAAASAFLYAVLTDRVLLIDRSNEMDELFCEPFPGTSWLLPRDFPLPSHTNFTMDGAETYGAMLKKKALRTDALPAFVYLYLEHDFGDWEKLFFCDDDQRLLSGVQWLVMRTDVYFVPGLFLIAPFMKELAKLFPERDAVFFHLGRYLFHPTNHVWGLVTRYYRAYLAGARRRVGIQVRLFDTRQAESPHVLRQITSCAWKEKLLPEVLVAGGESAAAPPTPIAVLVTSLKPWFYERIKGVYWEHATAGGEDVSVHQPSHEEHQRYGEKSHDSKAWAEIYLLSLCDALLTSGWSTFGYVAHGLGGVTPWVMYKADNVTTAPDPPCGRDVSMEPCFHNPPQYDCKLKRYADTGSMVPHVRHCEDVKWGVKLVDPK